MAKTASAIVKQAQSWVGLKESDGSFKVIIDLYNSHTPLARGYKVKYTDAWCATFASAVAIKLGYTDIIPTECSCEKMIALFKTLGCWVEDDSYTPSVGAYIFYDWDDSGSGDCTGTSDHVGIVEKVSGTTITVIEGNKSQAVGRRTMQVNGRYIRGYGVPKYSGTSTTSTTTTKTTTSTGAPNKTVQWTGKVSVRSKLNVRKQPSDSAAKCSFSGLANGTSVGVCDTVTGTKPSGCSSNKWYYIKYSGKYGYVHSDYVKK